MTLDNVTPSAPVRLLSIAVLGASLLLTACTGGSKKIEVENGRQGAQPTAPQGGQASEVPVILNEKALQAYKVNTDNLKYKMTYLTANQDGALTFDANGSARLTFRNLPAEQSGTLTLEILEGTTVKLRGSVENLKLSKGQNNNVDLELEPVEQNGGGGSTGQSTDLTIDVTLDNNGGGSNPPNTQPNNPPNTQPNNPPNTQPSDPIADWNGKSFKGNSRWKIVQVN